MLCEDGCVPGHLFVIRGDLTKLACDDVLIPTDEGVVIEAPWREMAPTLGPGTTWGDNSVIPHPRPPGDGPRVWLGRVGADERTPTEHFSSVIAAFAERARSDLAPGDGRAKQRLAVNLVGSGKGGAISRKGALIKTILHALNAAADTHDVDVVLVTWSAKAYAAVQHIRRVECHPSFPEGVDPEGRLMERAERLADYARSGNLVLFLGAGVSAGAGLPTWRDLLTTTAERLGLTGEQCRQLDRRDPRDAAAILAAQPNGDRFRSTVCDVIGSAQRYSLVHGLLASLPTCEAVTTNYDTLFEVAAVTDGRQLAVLPDHPSGAKGRWLLKLHGSIDDPGRIVITRSDYLNMPRQYGALMGLVQAMLMMRHMLFVGYSLSDEDFHELLYEVRLARHEKQGGTSGAPFGTVLPLFRDPLAADLWRDELDVVPMSVKDRPTPQDRVVTTEAARILEIFLDVMTLHATTSREFLLDDTFAGLLDEEERAVRTDLLQLARSPHLETAAGEPIRRFLKDLGLEQQPGRRGSTVEGGSASMRREH